MAAVRRVVVTLELDTDIRLTALRSKQGWQRLLQNSHAAYNGLCDKALDVVQAQANVVKAGK